VRGTRATADIPIIMITSRTAEKHRSMAFELGVNEYLGKPYQEDELMRLLKQYLAEKATA
jgi:chemosensory pili system protein ChpA (sensor histidine kinase/response regulator)